MSDLRIVYSPGWEDVAAVARNLRVEDRMEFYALTGERPEDTFISTALKANPMVVYWKGEPTAVLGVTEVSWGIAAPWMMGTPVLQGFGPSRALLKTARRLFSAWHQNWPVLTNRAYADNHLHIRFLEALGCDIAPPRPFGPFHAPFREFIHVRTTSRSGGAVRG